MPSRASGAGEPARKDRNAGPSSAVSIRAQLLSCASNPRRRGVVEANRRVTVGGPYFEDLERGQVFDAPAMTLTSGHAAIHQAITGDRMLLPLDAALEPGGDGLRGRADPSEPGLRCGDRAVHRFRPSGCSATSSTAASCCCARSFAATPCSTRTEVVALKQNRPRGRRQRLGPGGAADPDPEPARRAGAGLLSLPDDSRCATERRYRSRRRLRRDLRASSIPSACERRFRPGTTKRCALASPSPVRRSSPERST